METWRDIKGLYQISNLGRIKSFGNRSNHKQELILKPIKDHDGYYRVHLYKNAKLKTYFIHKLVAETFIENPDKLPIVNHKDENKTNNRVDNLEWCTIKYNNNYGNRLNKISKTNGKSVMCIEAGIDYSSIAKNCRTVAGGWKYIIYNKGGGVI